MKPTCLLVMVIALLPVPTVPAVDATSDAKRFWPQWRGPLASGVAPEADPPLEWGESKNLRWRIRIPGFGTSTPIVWGDRVFILTAIATGKKPEPESGAFATRSGGDSPGREERPERRGFRGGFGSDAPGEVYQFVVLCVERMTGRTLWQKIVREQVPHEGHHRDHGFASGSPVTDGQHLLAWFNSRGLYCFDLEGNLKWEKDFGDMQTRNSFGEGSSPALHGNTVVVNWDHERDDFIVALDKRTGKELWRTPRDEPTSWSTPLVVVHDGKPQVVVNATEKVRSYDLATGKLLWHCGGQTANVIPSPVAADGMVYVTSGFRGNALYAIQLGHTGDLAGTDAVRWRHNRSTPYVPSPLLVGDLLYVVAGNNGVLSCFDAKTGAAHFEHERLEGIFGIYASPVSAKDRVYVLGRDGTCLVLKKGRTLEVLARNKLDDRTDASLALVGKEVFVRGHQNLYCIAEP